MNALLLGLHQSNGNVSIDNYFDYCRKELPNFLQGWHFEAMRPGESHSNGASRDGLSRNGAVMHSQSVARLENYVSWPLRLTAMRADVFHVVDQNIAWYLPFLFGGRKIVTVHDLIKVMVIRKHLALADVPKAQAAKIKFCAEQLRKASALICVSHNTASCAMRELNIPSSRIHVVHNMIPPEFSPVSAAEKQAARKTFFGDAEVALLHVGKPSIYKNREGVLKIFERVRKRHPSCRLVITNSSLSEAERSLLEDAKSEQFISLQQPRTHAELRLLYGAADVFLFPSLYEGFGWPPVEAMACVCPVVCSPNGSLAEVVGDAAMIINDPHDHAAFANIVIDLMQDRSMSSQLTTKGFQNAARFTSAIVTPQLAAVYCSVC